METTQLLEEIAKAIEAEARDGIEYDSLRVARNKGLARAARLVRDWEKR